MATPVTATSAHLDKLLLRPTPFPSETGSLPMGEFEAGPSVKAALASARILVIGAGGLGSEILKDLALSGFRDIHVIDADTVDVTNLNRQFLFRAKDVGKPKAEVAAAFVEARVPGVKITPHIGFVQSMDDDFYKQFKLVLGGLDNLDARRWINAKLCSFVEIDEDGSYSGEIIPFIDGGTEGLKGQVKLMLPKISSCFECGLDAFPPETTFAMCTIAERPRKPEHCVAYAMMVLWDRAFVSDESHALPKPPPPNAVARKYDTDSPADMRWIYERAAERAAEFGITGVDYMMTLGVVKNIIPAVASTNAIISALAVAEAVKLVTFCSQSLNNFYSYMGQEGVNTSTYSMERKEDCLVCQQQKFSMELSPRTLLRDVLAKLELEKSLKKAALMRSTGGYLYMPSGKYLADTKPNLDKSLEELGIVDGSELVVDDETLPVGLVLVIRLVPVA